MKCGLIVIYSWPQTYTVQSIYCFIELSDWCWAVGISYVLFVNLLELIAHTHTYAKFATQLSDVSISEASHKKSGLSFG